MCQACSSKGSEIMKQMRRLIYRRHLKAEPACWLLVIAGIGFGAPPPKPVPVPKQNAALPTFPLSFEANRGQTDPVVRFLSRSNLSGGNGYALFLTPDSAVFKLRSSRGSSSAVVRMKLAGANRSVEVSGADALPGAVNYFIGNDPAKWITGASTYMKVNYSQIYKGVDLVYYGTNFDNKQQQLEYDFTVAAGADPGQIALEFAGAKPELSPEGSLVLTLDGAPLTFRKPTVYQTIAGERKTIAGEYRLKGDRVEFALGEYDHNRALVIDPVLTYFSYLGGSGNDYVGDPAPFLQFNVSPSQGIAADQAGNLYVTGFTDSTDFPVQSAYQSQNKGTPANGAPYVAFVTKVDPTGSHLIYSTYLGGAVFGQTKAFAVAVDSAGEAYVTGFSQQTDFPVTGGAYQTVCGTLVNNNQSTCGGSAQSAFLTKLSAGGGTLVYSTFLGPGQDTSYAVAVDSQGQAYTAGLSDDQCASNDPAACFPTTASAVLPGSACNHSTSSNFNQGSAFVAVFNAAGTSLLYSSLYGGFGTPAVGSDGQPGNNGATYGAGVAVDGTGNFYLAGTSSSNQLPVTSGAYQRYYGGLYPRGYIAKFSPVASKGGSKLLYATYLGGSDTANDGQDQIGGIAVDAAGNAYVTGNTGSYDFPITIGATTCTAKLGCQNTGFLTKVNPSGTALVWSTLVGSGTNCCSGEVAIMSPPRLDAAGNVYLSGRLTTSTGFPSVNPLQPANGFGGVFVTKLDPLGSTVLFSTNIYAPGVNGDMFPGGVDADPQGNIYVAGYTQEINLPVTAGAFRTTAAGQDDIFIAKINTSIPSPTVNASGIVPVFSTVSTVQPGEWVSIYGTNLASADATWTGNFPTSLGGTSVTFSGIAAYLWYVSPTQVNLQVPNGLSNGSVPVVLTTASGAVAFSTVTVAAFAPSFSVLDGKHVAGIILRSDGSGAYGGGTYDIIGPTGSSLGYPTVAAKAGDTVELYGVGFGPTTPPVSAGQAFSGSAVTTNPVQLTIGGTSVVPLGAGMGSAGLYNVNVTIPAGLGTGDLPLQASVAGVQTPTVAISLQ